MFVLSLVNRNVQAWDPRYVENDHDTLANSYLVTMAVYRWPQGSLIDRSRQSTTNSSVLRTKLPLWIESMMSLSRSLQHDLISIRNAQPQGHLTNSALQQDSNIGSSIWNWFARNYVMNECSVAYSARRMLRIGTIDQVSRSLYRNHKGVYAGY